MSCITEILKLKGEKDVFLPLDNEGKPWIAIEGGGTYNDYEYLIVMNKHGHRCGYVALPPEHKANQIGQRLNAYSSEEELDYMALNIDCHGGLTFGSKNHSLKTLLTMPCTDNWIGFDCGHLGDSTDFKCLKEYFNDEITESRRETLKMLSDNGFVRSFNHVEKECHKIIDQLLLAA